MPKKVFRFCVSNVALKRKLFGQSCRNKVNGKRSSKFVWLDDSIEINWKLLKSKSGCKTDKLFLGYLLGLAEKDLFNVRNRNPDEKSTTTLPKNEKPFINHENTSDSCTTKSQTHPVEKEKKMKVQKAKDVTERDPIDQTESQNISKHIGLKDGLIKKTILHKKCSIENSKTDNTKELALINLGCKEETESSLSNPNSDTLKISSKAYNRNRDTSFDKIGRKDVNDIHADDERKHFNKKSKVSSTELENSVKKKSKTKSKKELKQNTAQAKESKPKFQKIKTCQICNSKHSGNCQPDKDNNSFKPLNRNQCSNTSTKSLNNQKSEDNVYNFEDFDKNSCGNNKRKKASTQDTKFVDISYHSQDTPLENKTDDPVGQVKSHDISYAKSSLPAYFFLKNVNADHGPSVFTKIFLRKSTQLGPLTGQKIKEKDISDDFNMKDVWEVCSASGVSYISTQDPENSNWLRYIRPADNKESANLLGLVKDNNLYFDTTRDVFVGDELVYWTDDCHSAWSKKKLEKKSCGGCNIQFSHTLYYRKHCMIFHDPNSSLTTRKYHCKICGLAVLGKEKIMKHAAEMHQGKGAYQCQYCHKFFLRLNYLEMHRTYGCAKNPQRSRPLCDLCGKKFCQPQKLKVHIKRMHSDMAQVLKDFQCKNCEKILGSRAALQRHLKEVHNKDVVGACTCDRCGKIFQNKSNLKIHMLTHSGVKPFKCQEADCSAAFTTKQCLQFHYKKVHGFTDDIIPKIERSVAYTFDAYSGGVSSDPDQECSVQLYNQKHLAVDQKDDGINLTLSIPQNSSSEKQVFQPLLSEEPNLTIQLDEKYSEKGSASSQIIKNPISGVIPSTDGDFFIDEQTDKPVITKANKKLWETHSIADKIDLKCKPIFKENSNTSLLVETAISAAEKDMIERPIEDNKSSITCDNEDTILGNPAEVYSLHQYDNSSDINCESNDRKMSPDSPRSNSYQEITDNRKNFLLKDKSNFTEIFKFNNILRMNPSPLLEFHRENNNRDQDNESIAEIDNRNRDLIDICKENDNLYESYRNPEMIRSDKLDLCRSSEFDFRLPSSDKFDCRDIDFSNECRNLTNNLEKNRIIMDSGLHRLGSDVYDIPPVYDRIMEDERDGEVQNLCLKEKPYQCENLDLARIGRDNSGFESVFISDTVSSSMNQNFGVSLFRSSHGMVSPRPYHPTAFESESVDLSLPRPSFSSSPVYTLDLTPSRVDLTTRHLDFRSHLGLPPLRFGASSTPMVSSDGAPLSPTGYGIYQTSYGVSGHRPCQTSQFQPYTPLYY